MRGKHRPPGNQNIPPRSIPACAGETLPVLMSALSWTVYPRVCGGNPLMLLASISYVGLSPRVRGKHAPAGSILVRPRSIPACAGETPIISLHRHWTKVYPRVCGGNSRRHGRRHTGGGLSPRVRGKPIIAFGSIDRNGSIPACAGGNTVIAVACCRIRGLSPRVRGKRSSRANSPLTSGSIPACAGETSNPAAAANLGEVYPRVCGGN